MPFYVGRNVSEVPKRELRSLPCERDALFGDVHSSSSKFILDLGQDPRVWNQRERPTSKNVATVVEHYQALPSRHGETLSRLT